jgi:hypothetical protein
MTAEILVGAVEGLSVLIELVDKEDELVVDVVVVVVVVEVVDVVVEVEEVIVLLAADGKEVLLVVEETGRLRNCAQFAPVQFGSHRHVHLLLYGLK